MGDGLNGDDTEGETGLLGDGSVRLVVGEDRLGLLRFVFRNDNCGGSDRPRVATTLRYAEPGS